MTEKRLRPTKTISTKTLSSLSEKMCEKIKDAAYANIVNAVKNDKAAAEQVVADSYYILHVQQEFGDYCKIISGEYKTEKGLYDICEELRPFCDVTSRILSKKNVQFAYAVPESPIYVLIDCREIRQALSAMVLNSIEHIKLGGKIEVRVEETARTVKISVHDNGDGMDEETLSRCMEPFFSGRIASGNKQPLGLGLTLARYYVQDCGGRIRIKSFDKKATRAEIIIPKPKGFSVDEVRSVPKPLAGYDDSEIERDMALIL